MASRMGGNSLWREYQTEFLRTSMQRFDGAIPVAGLMPGLVFFDIVSLSVEHRIDGACKLMSHGGDTSSTENFTHSVHSAVKYDLIGRKTSSPRLAR